MAGLIYHGIDYSCAEALMRARRLRDRAQLLEDLQVMEGAAKKGLNRRE